VTRRQRDTRGASDSIAAVGESCPQLQHLNVALTGNTMSAAAMTSIAQNCPQLRTLDLSQSPANAAGILRAVAEHCSNLTALNLSRTSFGPIDVHLAGIAKRCPLLQRIDLSKCAVSDVGLTAIADHCHRLLDLSRLTSSVI